MKDTLIIGSSGYIGSSLINLLKDRSVGLDISGADVNINYKKIQKNILNNTRI